MKTNNIFLSIFLIAVFMAFIPAIVIASDGADDPIATLTSEIGVIPTIPTGTHYYANGWVTGDINSIVLGSLSKSGNLITGEIRLITLPGSLKIVSTSITDNLLIFDVKREEKNVGTMELTKKSSAGELTTYEGQLKLIDAKGIAKTGTVILATQIVSLKNIFANGQPGKIENPKTDARTDTSYSGTLVFKDLKLRFIGNAHSNAKRIEAKIMGPNGEVGALLLELLAQTNGVTTYEGKIAVEHNLDLTGTVKVGVRQTDATSTGDILITHSDKTTTGGEITIYTSNSVPVAVPDVSIESGRKSTEERLTGREGAVQKNNIDSVTASKKETSDTTENSNTQKQEGFFTRLFGLFRRK